MNKLSQRQGSALMTVLVIVSIMTALALSGSQIVMIQFANTRDFLNSKIAFYAAESGIERALLKYRLDRALEIENDPLELSTGVQANYSSIFKSDSDLIDRIEKNAVYEVEVFGQGNLSYKWDSAGTVQIIKAADGIFYEVPESSSGSVSFDNIYKNIRFHAYQADIKGLKLDCSEGECLAQHEASITSQGESGGVLRRLEAKIDRQTGLLKSLFDYTLYSRGEVK